jgi:hypothetical protein
MPGLENSPGYNYAPRSALRIDETLRGHHIESRQRVVASTLGPLLLSLAAAMAIESLRTSPLTVSWIRNRNGKKQQQNSPARHGANG